MKNRICVILLNWNGKKDTLECLDSLKECTGAKFTTLVVDNGSSDGSVAAIRAVHPNVLIAETGKNLGFAGGNNVGIEWALTKPFDWILLLNNDTVAAPDFLSALLQAGKQTPQAKILGAKILRYHERNVIDHLGGRWNGQIGDFQSLHSGQADQTIAPEPVDYVCGAALMMHRSVPEAIGLLEKDFFLFWEETDFCFRAKRRGFEVWTAPEARVWHKVSSSFTGGKPHSHYFWTRSRLLWLQRNVPYSERQKILKHIVYPELRKNLRHYFYRSLQTLFFRWSDPALRAKRKRLAASLRGALDYYRGRFGNCPSWLT